MADVLVSFHILALPQNVLKDVKGVHILVKALSQCTDEKEDRVTVYETLKVLLHYTDSKDGKRLLSEADIFPVLPGLLNPSGDSKTTVLVLEVCVYRAGSWLFGWIYVNTWNYASGHDIYPQA